MIEKTKKELDSMCESENFLAREGIVLIIEDHHIVREGMRQLIADVVFSRPIEILEAPSVEQACKIVDIRKGEIELILLDIGLPDADGNMVLNCLKTQWKGLPTVVVSGCDDWELAASFLKGGALGFIPKTSSVTTMINALRLVFSGERYFPKQIFEMLTQLDARGTQAPVQKSRDSAHKEPASTQSALPKPNLFPRENEVLSLMLKGLSNKEIARELGVSIGTVKNYVSAVLRAHSVSTRAKFMSLARDVDAKNSQ